MNVATIRTAASSVASLVLIGYGLVKQQATMVGMGIGVLGAPSIAVTITKNGDADAQD